MEHLEWKRGSTSINISSLKELFTVLVEIPIEQVDTEMTQNTVALQSWLESTKHLQLVAHCHDDYTAQQLREQIIRDLRQILHIEG